MSNLDKFFDGEVDDETLLREKVREELGDDADDETFSLRLEEVREELNLDGGGDGLAHGVDAFFDDDEVKPNWHGKSKETLERIEAEIAVLEA